MDEKKKEEEKVEEAEGSKRLFGRMGGDRKPLLGGLLREREVDLPMVPGNPGPKFMGRSPMVGMIRRKYGLPVVRDEFPQLIEIGR
jgi:hypothetical protein